MSKRNRRKPVTSPAPAASPVLSAMRAGIFQRMMTDGFSNPLARLGDNTPNLLNATEYVKKAFTSDYQTMTTLYRENWVVKRLIDVVPQDMLKNWYRLKTNLSPDLLNAFKRLERVTKVRARMTEGLRWGRLYGGAAALIAIAGHEDILDTPLTLDMVMPGSFRGLIILDRWSGISPDAELVTDISDPDFGLPKYYTISADTLGMGLRVHHSRLLRFIGRPLPNIEAVAEQHWGTSEVEHVMAELNKYNNTSYNIAMLVFAANLKVYKMEDMGQIATLPQKQQEEFYQTLCFMNWMMNNQGMQIIGQQDSFETHQYSFGGLSDVYELFMMDLAGAAEIPVTKFFGRSPAGMNATGESDLQNYYDSIEEKQESDLRPVLEKLLPVMMMSEFGAVPDDWELEFEPCRRPTEEEKKNLAINTANAVTTLHNAGIISQRMALRELQAGSAATGMWSGITDEDIERADDSFGLPGEAMPPALELPELGTEGGEVTDNDAGANREEPESGLAPAHPADNHSAWWNR